MGGCSQCHVDCEDELIGTLHLKESVGCKACHGPSEAHLADENNEVAPDHVFTQTNVEPLCLKCHECSRPEPNRPVLIEGKAQVCTDCHGPHATVRVPAK